MKIRINTRGNYYIAPIFDLLGIAGKKFGFKLEDTRDIPSYTIEVDGKLLAYISHGDGIGLSVSDQQVLGMNTYKLVFKFHYRSSHNYGKYQGRIIPCGLYRWWPQYDLSSQQILGMERGIDIMARMRIHCSNPQPYHKPWVEARQTLVQTAGELSGEGYNTKRGLIGREDYAKELLHTKTAFIWTGTAYLGWKIPEFLQQGVIMIHPTLGTEHPLREDITLEHGVHFVCCNSPRNYKKVAMELLKDKQRMESIRANIANLWAEKLLPARMADWYYSKLIEAK